MEFENKAREGRRAALAGRASAAGRNRATIDTAPTFRSRRNGGENIFRLV